MKEFLVNNWLIFVIGGLTLIGTAIAVRLRARAQSVIDESEEKTWPV
jgi:hypothetical protein